jgi:N-acetylglutamate synthase-like GNAT family acetyltransferase
MMGKDGINVRLAVESDLAFVGQEGYLTDDELLRKIDHHEEVYLVSVKGHSVGYLRLDFLWSQIPFIALIRILNDHRKKGLSRILLEFVEDDLRRKGYEQIYSSSQMDEPEPQAWHRHMGFEECGAINGLNAGGVGEVIFRKSL